MKAVHDKSILLVSENTSDLQHISDDLKHLYKVYPTVSYKCALDFIGVTTPGIIITDSIITEDSGKDFFDELMTDEKLRNVPVIVLVSPEEEASRIDRYIEKGAADCLYKPVSDKLLYKKINLLFENLSYRNDIETAVNEETKQLMRTQEVVIDILANATAYKDNETSAHISRISGYVELIVQCLRKADLPGYEISDSEACEIIRASKIHDIGKVSVPESILLKPDRLSPSEFERIKSHAAFGALMIEHAIKECTEEIPFLATAKELIYSHHECWDGSGYPRGIKGEKIPLSGRIMAIADVYDALISKRPYKNPIAHENAVSIIKSEAGTHFDRNIVCACGDAFDKFLEVSLLYADISVEL